MTNAARHDQPSQEAVAGVPVRAAVPIRSAKQLPIEYLQELFQKKLKLKDWQDWVADLSFGALFQVLIQERNWLTGEEVFAACGALLKKPIVEKKFSLENNVKNYLYSKKDSNGLLPVDKLKLYVEQRLRKPLLAEENYQIIQLLQNKPIRQALNLPIKSYLDWITNNPESSAFIVKLFIQHTDLEVKLSEVKKALQPPAETEIKKEANEIKESEQAVKDKPQTQRQKQLFYVDAYFKIQTEIAKSDGGIFNRQKIQVKSYFKGLKASKKFLDQELCWVIIHHPRYWDTIKPKPESTGWFFGLFGKRTKEQVDAEKQALANQSPLFAAKLYYPELTDEDLFTLTKIGEADAKEYAADSDVKKAEKGDAVLGHHRFERLLAAERRRKIEENQQKEREANKAKFAAQKKQPSGGAGPAGNPMLNASAAAGIKPKTGMVESKAKSDIVESQTANKTTSKAQAAAITAPIPTIPTVLDKTLAVPAVVSAVSSPAAQQQSQQQKAEASMVSQPVKTGATIPGAPAPSAGTKLILLSASTSSSAPLLSAAVLAGTRVPAKAGATLAAKEVVLGPIFKWSWLKLKEIVKVKEKQSVPQDAIDSKTAQQTLTKEEIKDAEEFGRACAWFGVNLWCGKTQRERAEKIEAQVAQIKKEFRECAKECHPDRFNEKLELSEYEKKLEERLEEIKRTYLVSKLGEEKAQQADPKKIKLVLFERSLQMHQCLTRSYKGYMAANGLTQQYIQQGYELGQREHNQQIEESEKQMCLSVIAEINAMPKLIAGIRQDMTEAHRQMMKGFAESDKRMAESDQRMAKSDQRMAESDRRMAESDRRIAEIRKQMHEGFAATEEYVRKGFAATGQQIQDRFAATEQQIVALQKEIERIRQQTPPLGNVITPPETSPTAVAGQVGFFATTANAAPVVTAPVVTVNSDANSSSVIPATPDVKESAVVSTANTAALLPTPTSAAADTIVLAPIANINAATDKTATLSSPAPTPTLQ